MNEEWLVEMDVTAKAMEDRLAGVAAQNSINVDDMKPSRYYPRLRGVNRSVHTKWTQTTEARQARSLAVSLMPSLLAQFPHDRNLKWHQREGLWREVVRRLKYLGLLSPDTAAVDVNVAEIVYEARKRIQVTELLVTRLSGLP